MALYAFTRAIQGMRIALCRDPRLYKKGDHLGALVPQLHEFVDAVRTFSLDDYLAGSEFESVHHYSMVKYAIGRAAFDVD